MPRLASFIFAAALGTAACHSKPPTSPEEGLSRVDPPKNPDLGHYPPRVSVEVLHMYMSDQVRSICAGGDPFFEFDSTKVGTGDSPTINNLARCMLSGPLTGKSIKLVGRTDPRGTEEYNEQLGLKRAEQVKQYLVSHGVEASRVQTGSLGKQDASPYPKDWPSDRRVQIDLVQ